MPKIVVSYVPVPHAGYVQFFTKHRDAETIYILGPDLISEFTHLHKDIHGLDPKLTRRAVAAWRLGPAIKLLNYRQLPTIQQGVTVVMPDEDINHELAEKYFARNAVTFDSSVFLRWDKHNSVAEIPVEPDQIISTDQFDRDVIKEVEKESEKSSDWWRHVGAAIVKDGQIVLITHNKHVPSPHVAYAEGNPRNNFKKGINVDLINVLHAEAGLIAEAAKCGISLEGTCLYVTNFPCPTCAKLVAYSGIKKCFYSGGYGVLDGERIMKQLGIEIILVDINRPPTDAA